jgi:phenylalanyl-tRNA synthetase beta chain
VNHFSLSLAGQALGYICALHPENLQKIDKKAAVVCAELDLLTLAALDPAPLCFEEPSKYPDIQADLSFLLGPGQDYGLIEAALNGLPGQGAPLPGAEVVGVFPLEDGARSVTVRLTFGSKEKTLARAQVQPALDTLVAALAARGVALKT